MVAIAANHLLLIFMHGKTTGQSQRKRAIDLQVGKMFIPVLLRMND
nr:hypothetical protein [Methanolobus psychrotolerans]